MSEPTEAPEQNDAQAAPKKKGGLLRILLIVLPFVLLPASAGAFLAHTSYSGIARTAAALGFKSGLQDEEEGHGEGEHGKEFGQFKVLSDLLVNPAGTNGKRFLMVNVGLESRSEEALAELESKDAVVRDLILQRLGERTVEELSSVGVRERLKEELRASLNEILHSGTIDRLYFTQFVLQ